MEMQKTNQSYLTILFYIFGHAAVGFMFGMIFSMIPWMIIVAPQIMMAGSTDIVANKIASPFIALIISGTIVWHVAGFLKQFGVRAVRYGLVAWIVSIIGSVPFLLFGGISGRRGHRPSMEEIINIIKDPSEIIMIGLIIGFILGTLIFISSLIAAYIGRRYA